MSNSERSFEQSSFENVTDDVFSPGMCIDSAPLPFGVLYGTRQLSSCPVRGPGDVFRFDSPFCATPPPLPPKPTQMSDHRCPEDTVRNQGQPGLLPRRTSLSGGEHFRRGANAHTHTHTQVYTQFLSCDMIMRVILCSKAKTMPSIKGACLLAS